MNEEYEEILNRLKNIENDVKLSNTMLYSVQRRARIAILFSAVKWIVILGFSLGLFYYTKPYIDQTMNFYDQVLNQQQQADSLFNNFKALFAD